MWSQEELTVPPSLIDTVNANTFLHLFNLKANETSIRVSITVILDQESVCFFLAALCKQPTGRLGDKPHEENDQDTSKALADEWNAPLIVITYKIRTVGNPGSGDTTTEPTAVIKA